jgi:hypothetical protein
LELAGMHFKLHPLLKAALAKHEFPLVLDPAAAKAACEHDILLDVELDDPARSDDFPKQTFRIVSSQVVLRRSVGCCKSCD